MIPTPLAARRPTVLAHVTTRHPALDARIFYKEARSALEAGFVVHVIGVHPQHERLLGIDVWPLKPCGRALGARLMATARAFIKVYRCQASIVHFHDPDFIPAAILLRLCGKRVVYDVHEFFSQHFAEQGCGFWRRKVLPKLVYALAEWLASRLFHRAVFATESLRQAIFPGHRSVALINLLPRAAIQPLAPLATQTPFDLVFLGSISASRAQHLLRMMSIILRTRPQTRCLLIGAAATTENWMKQNAPHPAVLNALSFQTHVPHAHVAPLVRLARVGFNYHPMQPRFRVAIPMKIYEYMAAGVAVVCSAFPELETQFTHGRHLLFVGQDDPAPFANAVLELLEDRFLHDHLRTEAHQLLREKLFWENSEEPKLVGLYRTLEKINEPLSARN